MNRVYIATVSYLSYVKLLLTIYHLFTHMVAWCTWLLGDMEFLFFCSTR